MTRVAFGVPARAGFVRTVRVSGARRYGDRSFLPKDLPYLSLELLMYIGLGTVLIVLLIVVVLMYLRRR